MQRRIILLSFIFVFSLLVISSCSKDDDNTPPRTKRELISKAPWKFSDAKVGGVSVSALLQACQKDNILTFDPAGFGTADEGSTKCNVTDQQSRPFTWLFQTNETELFVSTSFFSGGSTTFTIVSLTETELVVSQDITVSGTTQNAVITFVH